VQKVLQNLLEEGVPIRDMRTILDALAETRGHRHRRDRADLAGAAGARTRAIVQQHLPRRTTSCRSSAWISALDRVLLQALGSGGGLEPGLADKLLREAEAGHGPARRSSGLAPVLVVQHPLRVLLARFLRRSLPRAEGAVARRNP
jgi:flagellar biosynthesis protein FlhA